MEKEKRAALFSMLPAILAWSGLWGIFEATVGYFLHLLPFSAGWLVWYPAACFFMLNVYRNTRRTEAVMITGLLSACVKLLNLFLPGRVDRVLNPAVSIVLEALAMALVIFVISHSFQQSKRTLLMKELAVLCMNTGWRALYTLYLLFLVPDWMREVSVISSSGTFVAFFLVHNLFTSLALWGGLVIIKHILKPIKAAENRLSVALSSLQRQTAAILKMAGAICLLGGSILLGLVL